MENLDTLITSGIVAIAGPPNAGKSTLLNRLLGQRISIVTPKPQTTRNRISGVVHGDGYQVVFLDTPGLHRAKEPLNVEMVRIATDALSGVDLILFLIDIFQATKRGGQNRDGDMFHYLKAVRCPVMLVLNKIDLIDKKKLLPCIEAFAKLSTFEAVVPISADKGDGVPQLLSEIVNRLPKGPKYFPDDMPTDCSERFLCGEIIREKIFLLTGQEIPYSTAVVVESFLEEPARRRVTLHAAILIERQSQKPILIGRGGSKLKAIGIAARKDIETLLGIQVVLKLWVKVRSKWSRDETFIKKLGL